AINLLGGGDIFGNIEISADDAITVSGGETSFEGIINPDQVLEGSLAIAADGTLYMRADVTGSESGDTRPYLGAAQAYVEDFSIAAGGTLALELPNFSSPGLETDYPQIFADTADITGGAIEIRPSSPNGLYANSYFYDNVIDANTLIGTLGPTSAGGSDGADGVYAAS